jgi:hypothetical protein
MKIGKYTILSLFVFLSLFCFTKFTFAQEKIDNFYSEININKNGIINVLEDIKYDFGSLYKHGIYRNIPYIKTNQDGKKYILDIKVQSVTDENNKDYTYTLLRENQNLKIKIGDADRIISGTHSYLINYLVSGALTYFNDYDELYWNATGNEWQVPIINSSSKVVLPENVDISKIKFACFTGTYKSSEESCSGNTDTKNIQFQTTRNLSANEGLTVVVGFPKKIVAVLEPKEYISFWETLLGKIIKFIFFILIFFWYLFYPLYIVYRWFRYGRDPRGTVGEVRAWYDPPKTKSGRNLTPSEVGSLTDETVHLRDVSSAIVDLARRGYLKIIEKKKNDIYFEKIKNFSNDKKLLDFEKKLLDGIFEEKDNVKVKDLRLFQTVYDVKNNLYESLVKESFFPKNPNKIRNFYYGIAVLAFLTFNIPTAILCLIFGRIMPRKTEFGATASNIGKSLKNFLSSQERQLEFQAKNQMFFEKLLPYAVAFGVEKIWANKFKNINLQPPDWYQGYSNSFNSTMLVNSLNSSFKSVSASSVSSSSGFSSGFSSGGGFSGGGGGGGGGGSW